VPGRAGLVCTAPCDCTAVRNIWLPRRPSRTGPLYGCTAYSWDNPSTKRPAWGYLSVFGDYHTCSQSLWQPVTQGKVRHQDCPESAETLVPISSCNFAQLSEIQANLHPMSNKPCRSYICCYIKGEKRSSRTMFISEIDWALSSRTQPESELCALSRCSVNFRTQTSQRARCTVPEYTRLSSQWIQSLQRSLQGANCLIVINWNCDYEDQHFVYSEFS